MAAIVNFTKWKSISATYPADIRSRDPKVTESKKKNYITVGARLEERQSFAPWLCMISSIIFLLMLKNVLNEIHALNAHYFTHETGVVLIKFTPGRGVGGGVLHTQKYLKHLICHRVQSRFFKDFKILNWDFINRY